MRTAAGDPPAPLVFCPAHSGEKSPRPRASASARNGRMAAAARGNAGGRRSSGRVRALGGLRCPRGPSGEHVGQRGVARRVALKRRAMERAGRGFRTQQKRRARPAPPQRRARTPRRPPRVGDAAGGDHRDAHRPTICGTSANVPPCVVTSPERNMPRCPPASRPWAMIASNHAPPASVLRRRSSPTTGFRPRRAHPREQGVGRQTEMEADHRGPISPSTPAASWRTERPGRREHARIDPSSVEVARQRRLPRVCVRVRFGGGWQKKLTLNGLVSPARIAFSPCGFRRAASRRAASPGRRRSRRRSPGRRPTPAIGA